MDDLVDAIALVVERRASLPPELPLLLGEPETLSYNELQHTFARLIHGEDWETLEVPRRWRRRCIAASHRQSCAPSFLLGHRQSCKCDASTVNQ
jgi:hypothetical protein